MEYVIVDASTLQLFGPYAGIVVFAVALLQRFMKAKKLERRMKKLEEIVTAAEPRPPEQVVLELKQRFQFWKEEDA